MKYALQATAYEDTNQQNRKGGGNGEKESRHIFYRLPSTKQNQQDFAF